MRWPSAAASAAHRHGDVRHVRVAHHFVERFEIGLGNCLRLGRRILEQALQHFDLIELPCRRRSGVVLNAAEELRDALQTLVKELRATDMTIELPALAGSLDAVRVLQLQREKRAR